MCDTKDIHERLRALASSLEGDEWNHPITAVGDCMQAASQLEMLSKDLAKALGETVPDHNDNWTLTYTGKKFYPLNPHPEDVCIDDIAHALSLKCRYTGHCKQFYSVAQHSVECALRVPRAFALQALMHDAAEAYLFDCASPIKGYFPNAIAVEKRIMRAIAEALGFDPRMPHAVHEVDVRMCVTEMRDLMTGYEQSRLFRIVEPFEFKIVPKLPLESKSMFLQLFNTLRYESWQSA